MLKNKFQFPRLAVIFVSVVLSACGGSSSSGGGDPAPQNGFSTTGIFDFQWSNPQPQGNVLYNVAWNGTRFVAVGDVATILTSTDGSTWTQRDSTVVSDTNQRNIHSVIWTGTQFIAYGRRMNSITSPDGITWNDSGITSRLLQDVVNNGSTYVGYEPGFGRSTHFTSTDGLNWTQRGPISVNNAFQAEGMATNGTNFVIVSRNAIIASSPDGINWTTYALTAGTYLEDVTWAGTQFVAVGRNGAYVTSPDGNTWTEQTAFTTVSLYQIVWDGGQYVALSYTNSFTSSAGDVWTNFALNTDGFDSGLIVSLTWNGSMFVTTTSTGSIRTSTNGTIWTEQTLAATFQNLTDIVWDGGQFIATGYDAVVTSSNGINWTKQNTNLTSPAWLYGMTNSGSLSVAVGSNGTIATSANGSVWIDNSIGGSNLRSVSWNGSVFVAVGDGENAQVSSDGTSWMPYATGVPTLNDVDWSTSESLIVAVGIAVQFIPVSMVKPGHNKHQIQRRV